MFHAEFNSPFALVLPKCARHSFTFFTVTAAKAELKAAQRSHKRVETASATVLDQIDGYVEAHPAMQGDDFAAIIADGDRELGVLEATSKRLKGEIPSLETDVEAMEDALVAPKSDLDAMKELQADNVEEVARLEREGAAASEIAKARAVGPQIEASLRPLQAAFDAANANLTAADGRVKAAKDERKRADDHKLIVTYLKSKADVGAKTAAKEEAEAPLAEATAARKLAKQAKARLTVAQGSKTTADGAVSDAEKALVEAKNDFAEADSKLSALKLQLEKARDGVATSSVNVVAIALSVVGALVLIGAIVAGVFVMRRRRMKKGKTKGAPPPRTTVSTIAKPRVNAKSEVKPGSAEKISAKSTGTNTSKSDSKQESKPESVPPPKSKESAAPEPEQKAPVNDDKLAKTPEGKRIGKNEVEDDQGVYQKQKIGRWIAIIPGSRLVFKYFRFTKKIELDEGEWHALDDEDDEIKPITVSFDKEADVCIMEGNAEQPDRRRPKRKTGPFLDGNPMPPDSAIADRNSVIDREMRVLRDMRLRIDTGFVVFSEERLLGPVEKVRTRARQEEVGEEVMDEETIRYGGKMTGKI